MGTITVFNKTNTIPIITSKTITNYAMVSIFLFFSRVGLNWGSNMVLTVNNHRREFVLLTGFSNFDIPTKLFTNVLLILKLNQAAYS